MPKLTKKAIRLGRTDGRTDGPTLNIESFAVKNNGTWTSNPLLQRIPP